jgi:hypothetical protein
LDLRRPEVRAGLLEEAATPGPGQANVWCFGTTCTSFSDHQLQNGGTRTFSNPEGDGSKPNEVDRNLHAAFTVEAALALHCAGKLWIIENSKPSGRYPKIWDLPEFAKLRAETGCRVIAMDMCMWGKAPPDSGEPGQPRAPDEDLRYKKGSWWMVSKGLYLYALLLARKCDGQHKHVSLSGPMPGTSIPRTR